MQGDSHRLRQGNVREGFVEKGMQPWKVRYVFVTVVLICMVPTTSRSQALPGEPTALDDRAVFLGLRPSYQKCLDAADAGMPTMIRCSQVEYAYQDQRLNAAYKRLLAKLDATDRRALVVDERAWIKGKEYDCAIPPESGQGHFLDAVACSVDYTARRATVLERRLKK